MQLQAFKSVAERPIELAHFLVEAPAPYIFRVDFSRSELERVVQLIWDRIDKEWPQEFSSEDVSGIRASFASDKLALFMPVLNEVCLQSLHKQLWPKEPIYTMDFGVLQSAPDKYTLSCQVYLVPEGTLKNFSTPIKVAGVAPLDQQAIDSEVQERLQALRHSRSEERDRPGGVVEDGDMLYLKVDSRLAGVSWGPGQLPPTKVLWRKDKVLEELYFALLGKGVGNHQIAFTLPAKFGELAGKLIEADVSIFSVMTFVLPELTDTLEREVKDEVEKAHKDRYRGRLSEAVLSVLLEHVEHGPFPTQWLKSQAEDRYRSYLSQCKGDKALLYKEFGVSTDDEVMLHTYAAVKRQASTVIALVAYGRLAGLERGAHESIGSMSTYLNKALDHLLSNTQVL